MGNQTDNDRSRSDRQEGVGDEVQQPTGTSGRDADLQREGNLGNERNRNTSTGEEEDSELGNRGGFTR